MTFPNIKFTLPGIKFQNDQMWQHFNRVHFKVFENMFQLLFQSKACYKRGSTLQTCFTFIYPFTRSPLTCLGLGSHPSLFMEFSPLRQKARLTCNISLFLKLRHILTLTLPLICSLVICWLFTGYHLRI